MGEPDQPLRRGGEQEPMALRPAAVQVDGHGGAAQVAVERVSEARDRHHLVDRAAGLAG
jgi:hypothetical protein